jgi:uncharacterized protein YndB with AHSA1/START domain
MNDAKNKITVTTTVSAPVREVWNYWTEPAHITHWCAASEDWHAPSASNDLHAGGRFVTTMVARDGSARFDFAGTYTEVDEYTRIAYAIDDGRTVDIIFEETDDGVRITETFDPETVNPPEKQRAGWQAILDNFKRHVESQRE